MTGRSCRVWLPEIVLPAGKQLITALEGVEKANFAHLQRKHPGTKFTIKGVASTDVSPWKRLQVTATVVDLQKLCRVENDLVDLVETACDIVADILGLSDDQVQHAFAAIRVEHPDQLPAPDPDRSGPTATIIPTPTSTNMLPSQPRIMNLRLPSRPPLLTSISGFPVGSLIGSAVSERPLPGATPKAVVAGVVQTMFSVQPTQHASLRPTFPSTPVQSKARGSQRPPEPLFPPPPRTALPPGVDAAKAAAEAAAAWVSRANMAAASRAVTTPLSKADEKRLKAQTRAARKAALDSALAAALASAVAKAEAAQFAHEPAPPGKKCFADPYLAVHPYVAAGTSSAGHENLHTVASAGSSPDVLPKTLSNTDNTIVVNKPQEEHHSMPPPMNTTEHRQKRQKIEQLGSDQLNGISGKIGAAAHASQANVAADGSSSASADGSDSGSGSEEDDQESEEEEEKEEDVEEDEASMLQAERPDLDALDSKVSSSLAKLELFKLGQRCCWVVAHFVAGNSSASLNTRKLHIDQRVKLDHCRKQLEAAGEYATIWHLAVVNPKEEAAWSAFCEYFVVRKRIGLAELAGDSVYVVPPDEDFLQELGLPCSGALSRSLLALQVPPLDSVEATLPSE